MSDRAVAVDAVVGKAAEILQREPVEHGASAGRGGKDHAQTAELVALNIGRATQDRSGHQARIVRLSRRDDERLVYDQGDALVPTVVDPVVNDDGITVLGRRDRALQGPVIARHRDDARLAPREGHGHMAIFGQRDVIDRRGQCIVVGARPLRDFPAVLRRGFQADKIVCGTLVDEGEVRLDGAVDQPVLRIGQHLGRECEEGHAFDVVVPQVHGAGVGHPVGSGSPVVQRDLRRTGPAAAGVNRRALMRLTGRRLAEVVARDKERIDTDVVRVRRPDAGLGIPAGQLRAL